MEKKNYPIKMTTKQKYDMIWNIFFALLLIPTGIGIYFLFRDTQKFRNDIKIRNPLYKFPEISDFKQVLLILPIIIILKVICESAFMHINEKIMKKIYKNPKDEKNYILGKIYKRKITSHMFKGSYYLFITIFGWYVLKDLDYFPTYLLGKGYMPNMFLKGFPDSYYHIKPKFYDLCYMICLSYFLCDLIWLLFIYERQSDFINMFLHHICTISLISFSYLTNYSNIGSIILLIHNETDILVHLTRLLLQTDCPEIIKDISGVTLTINFLYMRLFVFAKGIYCVYHYVTWDEGWVTFSLVSFLAFLYCMHVNWALMLLQKAFVLALGTKLSDTTNYDKTLEKKEKEKEKEKEILNSEEKKCKDN